ncbi:YHYH domain-containing protein [Yersinia bercovieri]
MKKFIFACIALALMTTTIGSAFAHSGGTNADGCHTNSKTGDYHCHNKK